VEELLNVPSVNICNLQMDYSEEYDMEFQEKRHSRRSFTPLSTHTSRSRSPLYYQTDSHSSDRDRLSRSRDRSSVGRLRSQRDRYSRDREPYRLRNPSPPRVTEKKSFKDMALVVSALAANRDLDRETTAALEKVTKASATVSYKDRAKSAILDAGLDPSKKIKFRVESATCNPDPATPKEPVSFPLTNMVKSRLQAAYRNMLGLTDNEDNWDAGASQAPPKLTKFLDSVKKPKSSETTYAINSSRFSDKGLSVESSLAPKNNKLASVKHSRIGDWDKAFASVISIVNMMDIFLSSGNRVVNELVDTLSEFDRAVDVPLEVQDFLDKADRIKENQKSTAKALEDMTDTVTWLWTDVNLARRDNILFDNKKKLVGRSKELMRSQRLYGPRLFNDRVDEIMKEEMQRTGVEVTVSALSALSKSSGQMSYEKNFQQKKPGGGGKPFWRRDNFEKNGKKQKLDGPGRSFPEDDKSGYSGYGRGKERYGNKYKKRGGGSGNKSYYGKGKSSGRGNSRD
jgi:hypothetical protein